MYGRFYKNLGAVLPVSLVMGIWLSLADSFPVVVESPRLLDGVGTACLTVVYAFMATLTVISGLTVVVSALVTLLDRRGQPDRQRHSARVAGIVVFLTIMLLGHLLLRQKAALYHPLDLRSCVPLMMVIFSAWLLARFCATYIANTYNPANWPRLVGAHFSAATGVAVFIFGTPIAHFSGMTGQFYKVVAVALTLENVLYYFIFLILGVLLWLVLRFFFKRFAHTGLRSILAVFLLGILLPLVLFCRPGKPDNPGVHNPNPSNKGRNVILISIDTLRYDRVGRYIDGRPMTPYIDEFAKECVVFNQCIVPMPVTVPSHLTMHTGLIPRNHGVRVQTTPLQPRYKTLAELLSDNGLTCGGIVAVKLLTGLNSGLDQGFHYYDDYWIWRHESRFFPLEIKHLVTGRILNFLATGEPRRPNRFQRRAEPAVDSTLNWLDHVKDDDFFCFLHLFDVHWPYDAPEPYTTMYDKDYDGPVVFHPGQLNTQAVSYDEKATQEDFDHLVARYDGEVKYTDSQLKRLFDGLKERDLWDETMIILTSDHGESFEHDYFFGHTLRVYQSCIHVPFIIKPFGNAGGETVDSLCSTADIFPTVCDALGIKPPGGLDGVSLMPVINGVNGDGFIPHNTIYSESYAFTYGDQDKGRTYSIIRGDDKLIYSPFVFPYGPTYRLYNLYNDPDELWNLAGETSPLFHDLDTMLRNWVSEDTGLNMGMLGPDERETLKALQYLN